MYVCMVDRPQKRIPVYEFGNGFLYFLRNETDVALRTTAATPGVLQGVLFPLEGHLLGGTLIFIRDYFIVSELELYGNRSVEIGCSAQ